MSASSPTRTSAHRFKQRAQSAHHEAGHVVAAWFDPVPYPLADSVTVDDARKGFNGHVSMSPLWFQEMTIPQTVEPFEGFNEQIRKNLVVAAYRDTVVFLAGPIAESLFMIGGGPLPNIDHAGTLFCEDIWRRRHKRVDTDLDKARERLEWAFPDDPEAECKRAVVEAHDRLLANWETVERLAGELVVHGTLDGGQIDAVLP